MIPPPRIAHPAAGMQGTMVRAGSETNGELFEVEFLVEPGDRGSGRRGRQDMIMFSLLPGE